MSQQTYWCCKAPFGEHEPDCPNANKDDVSFEEVKAMLAEVRGQKFKTKGYPYLVKLPMTETQYSVWLKLMNNVDLKP